MLGRRNTRETAVRRAATAAGVLVAAAAAHKAMDKVQLMMVKKKAQKLGVGDERLDTSK